MAIFIGDNRGTVYQYLSWKVEIALDGSFPLPAKRGEGQVRGSSFWDEREKFVKGIISDFLEDPVVADLQDFAERVRSTSCASRDGPG